ncbi:MAG: hypothetical protein CL840_20495 [Crocinitomicaceae bacterium]|nr:hypothetical protein [Crocinitomicaceae bacterium]|tara:strand:+ start:3974 stop:4387 length:414 start_codon:yes stop_codon:yes gene_type:complete
MKKISDQEIQNLLDSDLNSPISSGNEETKNEVKAYRIVYQQLEKDSTQVPLHFSSLIAKQVFIENEKRSAIKHRWYSLGVVILVIGLTSVAFSLFQVNINFNWYDIMVSNIKLLAGITVISGLVLLIDRMILNRAGL